MRYAQIRKTDIANGEGIRVSLYVQGCHRHCFNCFNQETWDFCGGEEFDVDIENTLIDLIKRPHISGLTVLGGEPLELKSAVKIKQSGFIQLFYMKILRILMLIYYLM